METTTIGIKQLHTKLKTITRAAVLGRSFIVLKNARPVFRIEPVVKQTKKAYTLADIMKIRFRGREKNLSKKIDHIVYGS